MTNLEYIRTLPAEQLTKFIMNMDIIWTCTKVCKSCKYECGDLDCIKDCWMRFLKKQHKVEWNV